MFEDDEYLFLDIMYGRAQILPWRLFPDNSDTNPAREIATNVIFYKCKTKSQYVHTVHLFDYWLHFSKYCTTQEHCISYVNKLCPY